MLINVIKTIKNTFIPSNKIAGFKSQMQLFCSIINQKDTFFEILFAVWFCFENCLTFTKANFK